MFKDAFTQIKDGQAAKILDQLNPLLDGAPYDAAMVHILSHPLDFYDGYSLVEVSDYDVHPARQVSFIYKEDETLIILDGKNTGIYGLNQQIPISLNDDNIILYAKFFFHYVRGAHGRFIIVESVDDVDWREEPAPAGLKALGKMINPVSVKNTAPYELKTSIIFKDSLFESSVEITDEGTVSMQNQELLVEDIPVIDDHFGQ